MNSTNIRELRSQLYSGDGDSRIDAVVQSGLESLLQLKGEVVLLALYDQARGAAELARDCAGALRARGWAGDRELADALDVARGVRDSDELADLVVDLEQLADLLDGGPSSGGGRIDLTDGTVWPQSVIDDNWPGDEGELEDDERWLGVWPTGSREPYQDMIDFASTRTDLALRRRLESALEGKGAFRRFKAGLYDWPDDREEWFAFSDDRSRGRARVWLADEGYRPVIR